MKAYLAVLKDSFREALASRVLWILLALTTLVLGGGGADRAFGEAGDATPAEQHSQSAPAWSRKSRCRDSAGEPSPGKQIWSRWDDDLKTRLSNREGGGGRESVPPTRVRRARRVEQTSCPIAPSTISLPGAASI